MLMMSRMHEQIATQQRRALGQTANHVADALVQLALAHGQAVKGCSALSLRISQSDLAAMLAMSRQTVNKELRVLAQSGVIDAAYGRITVQDLDALRRAAEGHQLRGH
jgi:CRP-like cAMP-binding protein